MRGKRPENGHPDVRGLQDGRNPWNIPLVAPDLLPLHCNAALNRRNDATARLQAHGFGLLGQSNSHPLRTRTP